MEPLQQNPDLFAHLAADEAVDHRHPPVAGTASRLRAPVGLPTGGTGGASGADTEGGLVRYAEAAFDSVRGTIPHSFDSGAPSGLACPTRARHPRRHPPEAGCRPRPGRRETARPPLGPAGPARRQARHGRLLLPRRRTARLHPGRGGREYDIPALHTAPSASVLAARRKATDRAHPEEPLPAER